MNRRVIRSGTPWEPLAGYARAVKVGARVLVSGTTATAGDGSIASPGDAAGQTRQALKNLEHALERAGSGLHEVVRTRIYITRVSDWTAVAREHGEAFRSVLPTTTLVVVAGLIHPEMLVEIEAEAVCGSALEEVPPAAAEPME